MEQRSTGSLDSNVMGGRGIKLVPRYQLSSCYYQLDCSMPLWLRVRAQDGLRRFVGARIAHIRTWDARQRRVEVVELRPVPGIGPQAGAVWVGAEQHVLSIDPLLRQMKAPFAHWTPPPHAHLQAFASQRPATPLAHTSTATRPRRHAVCHQDGRTANAGQSDAPSGEAEGDTVVMFLQ